MNKRIPRRSFLRLFLGGIAAGYAGSGFGAGRLLQSKVPRRRLNGKMSYQIFAALVGETFTLTQAKGERQYRARAQLLEVNTVFLSAENDQFYLVFELDDNQTPPNGVYRLRHATAGSTRLFLQPMGNDMPGNCCRAEFNLLL